MFISKGMKSFLDDVVNIEYLLILVFSIFFYYRQLKYNVHQAAYHNPHFWIVSAYLIYTAGTFFLFLLLSKLSEQEQGNYYVVNYIFLIIKTVLLSIGMFIKSSPERPKKFQLT